MNASVGLAWRDLGDGIEVAELRERQSDAHPSALLWRHGCPADARGPESGGDHIPLTSTWSDGWSLDQYDPLTISPSVLCTACGRHGWIRDNVWIEA